MDFRRGERRSLIKAKWNLSQCTYNNFMHFYREYPTGEMTYKEFEQCAAQRLSLLQILDQVSGKGLKGEAWIKAVTEEMRKLPDLRLFSKLVTGTHCHDEDTDYLIRRRDHVSHFVLRLAYSSSEDKSRWFISREMDLFRFRWSHLRPEDRHAFLKTNNINYEAVGREMKAQLEAESGGMVDSSMDYYRIPFLAVSDLVKARRVYLKSGYAFITCHDIISVLLTSFRSHLSRSLSYTRRRIERLDEDERIWSVVRGASNHTGQVDYSCYATPTNTGHVDINQLDDLSKTSYPLCMENVHRVLKKEHHLRHFARQQYGLFLKGIGVTLEDSMTFWRNEFTKKTDVESFEKKYSYNIRHNYGKEGKMANYTPHSCLKIINSSVNPGDAHGCPFRHKDPLLVRQMLIENSLSLPDVEQVIGLMRRNQYQMACSKYFEVRHGGAEFGVNHPNAYFNYSRQLLKPKTNPPPSLHNGEG